MPVKFVGSDRQRVVAGPDRPPAKVSEKVPAPVASSFSNARGLNPERASASGRGDLRSRLTALTDERGSVLEWSKDGY